MFRALCVVLAASTSIAWAQFQGLATPHDGSVVYLGSTLRLKGSNQPNYPKLFVADESGVRLFRVLPKVDVQSSSDTCVLGSQYNFLWTQVSANGSTVAAIGEKGFAANCNNSNFQYSTDLITATGEREVTGSLYLSPGGRYAVVDTFLTVSPYHTFAVLDLQTGASTPIALPTESCFWGLPGARPIADNGTVILSCGTSGAGAFSLGFMAKLGEAAQAFPVSDGIPSILSADGGKVLYGKGKGTAAEIRLLDLNTQQDQFVLGGSGFGVLAMSDDASRILLWSDRPYIIQSDGTGLKALTANPLAFPAGGYPAVALSGNGEIVYIVTAAGELLKIKVETAEVIQLIGRTPYVMPVSQGTAGLIIAVGGTNLTNGVFNATPPLPNSLGNVTVHIDVPNRGGRGNDAGLRRIYLPIQEVFNNGLNFLLPWDFQRLGIAPLQPLSITVEAPGVNTPFDFPQILMSVRSGISAALDLPNGLPHRGEQFQVRAFGLGPVYPEVPLGSPSPSVEPLSRLIQPLTCIDEYATQQTIPVLYAGLLAGSVERIYQVTLQAPSDFAGVHVIKCSLGGGPYLDWVQIQVLP